MGYLYNGHYSVVKNDMMTFSGKWMGKKSPCEIPASERQTWYVIIYKWIVAVKQRITMLQSTDLEKLSNKDYP